MKQLIVVLMLFVALPAFAQRRPAVDNMKSFRQDLSAAVTAGSLTADEKATYDKALAALDAQREARKSGGQVDRAASRQAMQDLVNLSKSPNLKEEDRAKLAKHLENTKQGKGRRKR